jgi:hypothetical protein
VNRPFAAFGTLAALTTLAMFAVSATSRSTTVQLPQPPKNHSAENHFRGANFVLILPAEERHADSCDTVAPSREEADCNSEILPPCDTPRPGDRPALTRLVGNSSLSSMRGARIEAAWNAAAVLRTVAPMDCRSYYDAEYDRIVYGAANLSVLQQSVRGQPAVTHAGADIELTEIFQSFLSAKSSPHPRLEAGSRLQRTPLRNYAAAFRNWLVAYAALWMPTRPTPEQAGPMDWDEYADLIEDASKINVVNPLSSATSRTSKSVRSGDWLRHSAAATLYGVAGYLQEAAHMINQDAERPAASPLDSAAR